MLECFFDDNFTCQYDNYTSENHTRNRLSASACGNAGNIHFNDIEISHELFKYENTLLRMKCVQAF